MSQHLHNLLPKKFNVLQVWQWCSFELADYSLFVDTFGSSTQKREHELPRLCQRTLKYYTEHSKRPWIFNYSKMHFITDEQENYSHANKHTCTNKFPIKRSYSNSLTWQRWVMTEVLMYWCAVHACSLSHLLAPTSVKPTPDTAFASTDVKV